MNSHESYFEYLKTRSLTGLFYRRLYLYPKLCRHLDGRVLDVGCGLGDMLTFRPNTVGVDINSRVVEWCKAKGLDAKLMQPDALPFQSGTFSSIVLDNVLEHLLAPGPLLSEIHRVLTTGGRLVVGVPGRRGYDADTDHKVFYNEIFLTKKLAEYDFVCQKMLHMPLRCPWLSHYLPQYCIYGIFTRI
jgi:SAM-dependent methyltransferase